MLSQLVTKVNRNIRRFNLQISRGPTETDGTVYYALINTADNEITRLSNHWSQKELLYFRRLVSAIIESRNGTISSTKALNTGREDDLKFTMTSAESLINKWVEQKWLEEINDGSLAIGVRTLLEMNVYIREYFEVQDCFRCKTLCIRGSNCVSCDIKLHFHCVDSQFIPQNKCPNCGKQFTTTSERLSAASDDDTEEDTEEDEEVVQQNQRSKRSKRI